MIIDVIKEATSGANPKSVIIEPPSVMCSMKYEEKITPTG